MPFNRQMLGVVTALREEGEAFTVAGWRSLVPSRPLPALAEGEGVVVLAGGIGPESARRAVPFLLGHFSPHLLLSFGYGGGLVPALRTGDVVVVERSLLLEGGWERGATFRLGPQVETQREALCRAQEALRAGGVSVRTGATLTVPRLVARSSHKALLGRTTDALVAEMESYWVGASARQAGVPFLAVRVVLDPVVMDLPRLVLEGGEGGVRLPLGGPWTSFRLLALAWAHRRARRALYRAGQALMKALA